MGVRLCELGSDWYFPSGVNCQCQLKGGGGGGGPRSEKLET